MKRFRIEEEVYRGEVRHWFEHPFQKPELDKHTRVFSTRVHVSGIHKFLEVFERLVCREP